MHMVQKLKPEILCRDPTVATSWQEDPLCHDTGTLEGLAGMLERGDELDRDVVVVKGGSFWIGHGTEDQITSYDASKRWFDRLAVQDKVFKSYDGWYHVCRSIVCKKATHADHKPVHGEPGEDKRIFANDVADWVLSKADSRIDRDDAESKSKL